MYHTLWPPFRVCIIALRGCIYYAILPMEAWTHQMCFENFVFVLWGDFWLWLKLLVVWRQSTCHVILTQQFWFFDFCGGRRGHVMILRDWNLLKKKTNLDLFKEDQGICVSSCVHIYSLIRLPGCFFNTYFLIYYFVKFVAWSELPDPVSTVFANSFYIRSFIYISFFFKQMKWNQIKWETIWNTGCNFSQRPVTDVVVVYSIPHSQRTDTCGQCSAAFSWWRRYNKEREMELTAGI